MATLCCSPLETPTAAGNPNPDQRVRVRARGEGYPNPNPSALALIVRWQVARHYGIPAASWLDLMTQAGGFQGPAKSALLFDRRTHPSAAGHALAATLLQRRASTFASTTRLVSHKQLLQLVSGTNVLEQARVLSTCL